MDYEKFRDLQSASLRSKREEDGVVQVPIKRCEKKNNKKLIRLKSQRGVCYSECEGKKERYSNMGTQTKIPSV